MKVGNIVQLPSVVPHRTYHYFRYFLRNMQKSKPTKSAFIKLFYVMCVFGRTGCTDINNFR